MSAIWDGDTGHVTIAATKNGAAVNLAATNSRTVIVRNVETDEATTLDEVSAESDLSNGVIVADASPLEPGDYSLVLRCVDASVTATYPGADQPAEVLTVIPDLDATS